MQSADHAVDEPDGSASPRSAAWSGEEGVPIGWSWQDGAPHTAQFGWPDEVPETTGERLALFKQYADEIGGDVAESESSAKFTTVELTEQDQVDPSYPSCHSDPYSYGYGVFREDDMPAWRGPPRLFGYDSSTEYEESEDEDEEMGENGLRKTSRPSAAQRSRRAFRYDNMINAERHLAQHHRCMLRDVQAELVKIREAKVQLEEQCRISDLAAGEAGRKREEADRRAEEAEASSNLARKAREKAERNLAAEREVYRKTIKGLEERLAGTGGDSESGVKLEVDM